MRDYFRGATSLRTKGEWFSLWLTLFIGPAVLAVAGNFIHEAAGYSTIIFLAVIAMIYVTLARGQLLGSSVLIDKRQFPEVFAVVERCSSLIGLPVPLVFVRDDMLTPVVALGFGEPYSLVLSSHWLKHFKDDELTFMIGRELGNIAAGHTRITSLLSVNGRENALIALIFGAWLRRTEYTADRFGLLCCGSVEAAERAIVISTFHHFGREIDIAKFAQQRDEFGGDSVLNMGEWISAQPYATNRMARLRQFSASALFTFWEEQILASPVALKSFSPAPRSGRVARADCAGFGRRFGALLIDVIAVTSLFILSPGSSEPANKPVVQTQNGAVVRINGKDVSTLSEADIANLAQVPSARDVLLRLVGVRHTTIKKGQKPTETYTATPVNSFVFEFLFYNFLLVALSGQTLGMMILAVKVTRTDFKRPSFLQTLWRYAVAPLGVFTFLLGPFVRVELHDKLSRTRVVRLESTFERAQPALLSDGSAARA